MRAGEKPGTDVNSWIAAADHAAARLRARKIMRAKRDERRAKSVRIAIVVSFFLVLLAAAVLVGQAVIDPLLRSAAAARDGKRTGEIVYSMPDGSFCRHLSFDNETAEVTEGAVEQCPSDLPRGRARAERNFAWGGR